ncbi:MAG: hypothetical protein MI867_27380 [Pseudomonadales bacterium]|nr:hypothetical protein [Pseudomonadales bacterium]
MSELSREALIAELKEKHIQFVMSDLEGESLKQLLSSEVVAIFSWLQSMTLNELIDRELVKEIAHHSVKHAPYTQRLHEVIVKTILVGIKADINKSTTLATIVPKDEFDDLVMHMAQYEEVRVDVIRAVLKSPIYSELISDVLYHGIKDYVMNENVVTKKVPGVGSLMKMGAKSINKAMPNLENMAEGAVKKYIEANINRTLDLSEKILNNSLNEHNIKKVADHFWDNVEGKEFSLAADYVSESDIDKGVDMAKRLWLEVRDAEYIHNMMDLVIDDFFTRHGEEELINMVNELGFDQAYVTEEVNRHLPDVLAKESIRTFIESRVRSNLERFYESA